MDEKLKFVKENISWLIPTVISILTALGYASAYIYEIGFCNEYGIPKDLIEIDLSSILYFTLKLILFYSATLIICWICFLKPIQKAPKKLPYIFNVFAGIFPIAIIYILMYWDMWRGWVPILISAFSIVIIYFIWEFLHIIWTKIKSVLVWFWANCLHRLLEILKITPKKITKNIKGGLEDETTTKPVEIKRDGEELPIRGWKLAIILAVAIPIIIFWGSFSIGQADAKTQDTFLIVTTNPEYSVVLRIYGDNMICLPINKIINTENKTEWVVNGSIFVVILNDSTEYKLTYENIGIISK